MAESFSAEHTFSVLCITSLGAKGGNTREIFPTVLGTVCAQSGFLRMRRVCVYARHSQKAQMRVKSPKKGKSGADISKNYLHRSLILS